MTLRRPGGRAAITAGAVTVLLGLTGAAPAVAAPGSDAVARDASARTAVEDLPATGPVRVVAVGSDAAGRPTVEVQQTRSPEQAAAVIDDLRDDRAVTAIELDQPVRAFHHHPAVDDPRRPSMWGLTRLQAEHVWSTSRGDGVVVAVVDSGVDGNHPDLRGALVPGADFVGSGDGLTDPNGHGTHVAGTVVARPGNGVGVAGLAPGAAVMPVRVLDEHGSGWSSDIAKGVRAAVDGGADVVNLSLGGAYSAAVDDAVQYALAQDVAVVAAMGNSGPGSLPVYPAALPGVIAVGATTSRDEVASFSSTGSHIALAAPGAGIDSTYPSSGYKGMSGTSMAAPHVSAVAALLRSVAPELSQADVRARLVSTALDVGPVGFDEGTGAGLVDPAAALQAAGAVPDVSAPVGAAPATPVPGVNLPRDWQGDGRADVLAVDSVGRLHVYTGSGSGTFSGRRQIGSGWTGLDLITVAGDWDGDGHPDIVARTPADGALRLYSGNGRGGFLSARQIGSSWNGVDALLSPGDWNGDGRRDLLARRAADGSLLLYLGNGRGGFSGVRQVGYGWGAVSMLTFAGDWDSDGRPDIIARDAQGRLLLWSRDSRGGFTAARTIGTGWGGMATLTGPADWDGDRRSDVLAVAADGTMRLYPGNGTGGFKSARVIGTGWSPYRLAV